jgi:uncharacterized protein
MAKRFFRKYMPSPDRIRSPRLERLFGKVLHEPNLWHLNRASVSRAFGVGLFWAMVPMPFQMIPAAFCAIKMRANMGLSLALVWVSNPFTMGPIMFMQYWIGRQLLGRRPLPDEAGLFRQFTELSNWLNWTWITTTLERIGTPLYVGAVLTGVLVSLTAYLVIQLFWRWYARKRWRHRCEARQILPHMKVDSREQISRNML